MPQVLRQKYGITKIVHWTGRDNLKGEPRNIVLVVVITGFASHAAVKKAKSIAKKNKARIVYVNRSLARLAEAV